MKIEGHVTEVIRMGIIYLLINKRTHQFMVYALSHF